MFAFGDRQWPGLAKIAEEIGELGQVIGRLMMTHGKSEHWSGADLRSDFIDEAADVMGALKFFQMKGLSEAEVDRFNARAEKKVLQFLTWHREQQEPEDLDVRQHRPWNASEQQPTTRTAVMGEHSEVLRSAGIPVEGDGQEHGEIMREILGR